jgi:hypothetical protein
MCLTDHGPTLAPSDLHDQTISSLKLRVVATQHSIDENLSYLNTMQVF